MLNNSYKYIIILLIFFSCTQKKTVRVPGKNIGVIIEDGIVDTSQILLMSHEYYLNQNQEVVFFKASTQMFAIDTDEKVFYIVYRLDGQRIPYLYKKYGKKFEEDVIKSRIRSIVLKTLKNTPYSKTSFEVLEHKVYEEIEKDNLISKNVQMGGFFDQKVRIGN